MCPSSHSGVKSGIACAAPAALVCSCITSQPFSDHFPCLPADLHPARPLCVLFVYRVEDRMSVQSLLISNLPSKYGSRLCTCVITLASVARWPACFCSFLLFASYFNSAITPPIFFITSSWAPVPVCHSILTSSRRIFLIFRRIGTLSHPPDFLILVHLSFVVVAQ
jgi:hypothetical protein